MRTILILIVLITVATPLATSTQDGSNPISASDTIVEAANHFLSLLSEDQREQAHFPFESDERTFWNFLPLTGQRKGLSLDDMSNEQRIAMHGLLQATLSAEGYLKVTAIQQLERWLGEITNRPDYRNPGAYYLSVFGTPATDGVWGWRYEGHHLSMNISMINGEISATPTFFGTNPGQVRETVFAGLEILHEEIGLARQLMYSFDEAQQKEALIADKAPREIITGNDRVAILDHFEGIPYRDMNPQQQKLLMLLVSTYAHNLEADIAIDQLSRIREAGIDNLYFSWAGSFSPTEGHYFRIHGPKTLIEYDNVQGNANHVHTVWRDLENDFGRDLSALRQHYDHSDHHH